MAAGSGYLTSPLIQFSGLSSIVLWFQALVLIVSPYLMFFVVEVLASQFVLVCLLGNCALEELVRLIAFGVVFE